MIYEFVYNKEVLIYFCFYSMFPSFRKYFYLFISFLDDSTCLLDAS